MSPPGDSDPGKSYVLEAYRGPGNARRIGMKVASGRGEAERGGMLQSHGMVYVVVVFLDWVPHHD